MKFRNKQNGASYVEVVIAIGIFSLIAGTIAVLTSSSLISGRRSGDQTEASAFNQEASEALRTIAEEHWNLLAFQDDGNLHGIDNSGGEWTFSGASNTNGIYTRTIDVNDVERDGSGDVNTGLSDIETKEVTVSTSWTNAFGQSVSEDATFYVTNWARNIITETTVAEFNDGTFVNTQTDSVGDGEIILESISGGGATYSNNWTFSNAGDYTFNPSDIEVSGSIASLVETAGGIVSGSTTNPGFDLASGWTSGDWNVNGPEYHFTQRYAFLGNPSWWVYHYFSTGNGNRDFGGYWQQSFTTTVDDPAVTIDLEHVTWTNNFSPSDSVTFYAFVESTPGPPSNIANAVWSQSYGSTYTWLPAPTFTDNDNVTTAGTYYLKIAVYVDKNGGSSKSGYFGFDNVQLNWSKATTPTFPSTSPSITANNSWDPDNKLLNWSSFTETATKNGGEIYYQLSTDNGTTWQYWDGASWSVAGTSNYNTASVVNANISTFDTSTGQVTFRAFLESDGTHDVELENIQIEAEIEEVTMEVGTVNTDENWTTVNTAQTYTSPVITAFYKEHTAVPTNDAFSVSARIKNAGSNSFEVRLEDPTGADLNPADIAYIVMEEGDWIVGSTKVEAYKENISTVAHNSSWVGDNKSYTHSYASNPVVLHQVMSASDTDWIESWVSEQGDRGNPPDTTGFQIALNASEVNASNSHGAETIGWMVFEAGQNDTIGSTDFRTRITSDSIQGHSNGCDIESYGASLASPVVIADQQKMDGPNGGWLVECSISSTTVGVHIEEDQEQDSERSHTTEIAAYVVFDGVFSVNGKAASGYQTSGTYESSDLGIASNFNVIKWSESLPAGTDIQIQIKTAPDNTGSPGTYTATWSGPEGDDGDETDYFTNPDGELIHPDHIDDQWIKYLITLTGNGADTPIFDEITIIHR